MANGNPQNESQEDLDAQAQADAEQEIAEQEALEQQEQQRQAEMEQQAQEQGQGSGGGVASVKTLLANPIIKRYVLIALAAVAAAGLVAFVVFAIVASVANEGGFGKASHKDGVVANEDAVLATSGESDKAVAAVNDQAEKAIELAEKMAKLVAGHFGREDVGEDGIASPGTPSAKAESLQLAAAGLSANDPTSSVTAFAVATAELKADQKITAKNDLNAVIKDLETFIKELNIIMSLGSNPRLAISAKDKYYIRTHQVDDRILRALIYLVTPTDLGGAGFRKIKVRRIKSQYDTEGRSFDNEWVGSEEIEEGDKSISAHFDGQAMDISGIDMVDRRLYKKRVIKKMSKVVPQPPVDIEVALQSTKSGGAYSDPGSTSDGATFGNLFENQASRDLLTILGENTGYDFSNSNVGTGSMEETSRGVGLVVMQEEMGLNIDPTQDNSSFDKLLMNVGNDVLAKCMEINPEALKMLYEGQTPDITEENVGREELATRMNLLPGSLRGENSGEIFYSAGLRKIENLFGLKNGSFDNLKIPEDINVFIGQVFIEQSFNFPGGSFRSNNLAQIKASVGEETFNKAFAKPDKADMLLNLSLEQESTAQFLSGNLNPLFFKRNVAQALLNAKIGSFKNYSTMEVRSTTSVFSENATYTLQPGPAVDNSQDEVWNLPEGSTKRLLDNDFSVFYDIGVDEVSKRMSANDDERLILKKWFTEYKNVKLNEIGYTRSTILNELVIKKVEDIRNGPNQGLIDQYNVQIKVIDDIFKNNVFSSGITASERAGYERQKKILEERIRLENLTESGYAFLTEGYYDDYYGLPVGGMGDVFVRDRGNPVFFDFGANKMNFINMNLSNPDNPQNAYKSQLSFLEKQKEANENTLRELEERKANGESVDSEIAMYKRNIKIWEDQIRMVETNMTLEMNKDIEANKYNTAKGAFSKIGCSKLEIRGILNNHKQDSMMVGATMMESIFGLPEGSLSRNVGGEIDFSQGMDPAVIGQRHIEKKLSIPLGQFKGRDILELSQQFGGYDKLMKYFSAGSNIEQLVENLPIREANERNYAVVFKKIDKIFGLVNEETLALMRGMLKPDDYAQKVGDIFIRDNVTATINDNLSLDLAGYNATYDDVKNLMKGEYLDLALKVGLKNIDEGLEIPYGTAKAMIENPGKNCVVEDETTGLRQNCLESLLVANGQQRLARFMGLFGDSPFSGNISENMGQEIIEEALEKAYPDPAMPAGWFKGGEIKEIVNQLSRLNYPQSMINFVDLDPGIKRESETKILRKFGFTNINTLTEFSKLAYVSGSPIYDQSNRIDDLLHIQRGYTSALLKGTMTVKEYKDKVRKAGMKSSAEDWILDSLPGDIKDGMEKFGITGDDLKMYYKLYKNPVTRKAATEKAKGYGERAEDKAGDSLIAAQILLESTLDPEGTIAPDWFYGANIDNVVYNIAYHIAPKLLMQGLVLKAINARTPISRLNPNDPIVPFVIQAEDTLLSFYGIDPAKYRLATLGSVDFSEGNDNVATYMRLKAIDEELHLVDDTSIKFLKKEISLKKYKEDVKRSYLNYQGGEIVYGSFLPDNVKETAAKYGITPEEMKNAVNDPNAVRNKAVVNMVQNSDMRYLVGLGLIKLPIKGEFDETFAQQLIEERLGLSRGSFSPNSTIEKIMQANGPKKFATSFKLAIGSNLNDTEAENLIKNTVFKEGSLYWLDPISKARSKYTDNTMRIGEIKIEGKAIESPTRSLLTGQISVATYIEFVRRNQFDKLDPNGLAEYLTSGDPNDPKSQELRGYVGATALLADYYKKPKDQRDPEQQREAYRQLQRTSHVDFDDKLGFTPGTMEKLIMNPDKAKTIMMAQGIRSVGEKMVFGDLEGQKGNLLTLFQYYAGIDQEYVVAGGDPNSQACRGGTENMTEEQAEKFIRNRKTLCQNYIVNQELKNLIYDATTIEGQTGGIMLPDEDLEALRKGDLKILNAMGFTYTVNTLRSQDDGQGGLKLIPSEFHVSYDEIKCAMWGCTEKKEAVTKTTADDYKKKWAEEQKQSYDDQWRFKYGEEPPSDEFTSTDPDVFKKQQEYEAGLESTQKPPLPGIDKRSVDYYSNGAAAIEEAQKNVIPDERKNLQFRYVDAQMFSLTQANNLPPPMPGFSKAVFQGTEKERNGMYLAYGIQTAIYKSSLPTDLRENQAVMTALNNFVQTRDMDTLKNNLGDAPRDTAFAFADKMLSEEISKGTGIAVPQGTAKFIYDSALGRPTDNDFGDGLIAAQIGGFMDKQLGLPSGTTSRVYGIYKDFKAGTIGKGDAIAMAITLVFGKQLAKLDANIGLPPGSLSSIISACIVGGPVAWAMVIFTVFFGFSKVEYQITCPGDYTFTTWCKEEEILYTQWAQINTQKLINDMLKIEERTGDDDLLPTMIGTFRQEDVDFFYGKTTGKNLVQDAYGPPGIFRGVKGLWQSDYMSDFVHIGY